MSAAEKYGSAESFKLTPEQQTQVQSAGATLAKSNVKVDTSATEAAAVKYGAPANNHHERSLSKGRQL